MIIRIALVVIVLSILFAIVWSIFKGSPVSESAKNEILKTENSSSQPKSFEDIKIADIKIKEPVKPIFAYLYAPNQTKASGYVRLSLVAGKILIQLKSDSIADKAGMIFKGNCSAKGEILYPLVSLKDGKSQTIWETDMESIAKSLPLSIKVFKDLKDLKSFTRCADIKMP